MGLTRHLSLAVAAGLAIPTSLMGQIPPPMPGPRITTTFRVMGPAPTGLQITAGNPGTVLVWQGVADPAGYRVYRTSDPATKAVELTTAAIPETKFLDLTAVAGGIYYYTVEADYVDKRLGTTAPMIFGVPSVTRSGAVVSPVISMAPAPMPVGAPTNLLATATPVEVTLNWTAAPWAQSYEVARVTPSGQVTVLTRTDFPLVGTTLKDNGVEPGTSYRYDVTAIGGRGDRATVQKSIVPPMPTNPTGLTSSVKLFNIQSQMTPTLNVLFTMNGEVTISWQPVPGATSYRVAGPNIYQYRQVWGTSTTVTQVPPGEVKYTVVADFTNGYAKRFAKDQPPSLITLRVGSTPVQGFSTSQPGGGLFQWYDQTGATGFHLFYADRPGGPYLKPDDTIGPTWGYHRDHEPGRTFWYKVLSTFPNAPAAMTEPLMVIKTGEHNVTGLEVVSNQAGAVKIQWHPIGGAWYHVYAPSGDLVIPEAKWLDAEFLDPNTQSGKSYSYNVCATRMQPHTSVYSYKSKCAQLTVAVP